MKRTGTGWGNVLAGVLIFSGSLPATRLAVAGFDPVFLTFARASAAGIVAAFALLAGRQRPPLRRDVGAILVVAACVVVGFPLLSALALEGMTAVHSLVFVGILPLATATFAVVRGRERQPALFWLFAVLGAAVIVAYALLRGPRTLGAGDLLMFAAVVVCGYGYAEGAVLSRRYGGWQVISWALVASLAVMIPLMVLTAPRSYAEVGLGAVAGLAYVSFFSMFLGFVFWYRGLAIVGAAAGGQLQLLQPFLGVVISAIVLRETVPVAVVAVMLLVAACVAGARRAAA